ncbi:MAG TPA: ArsR family transcriptional regulator [Propionibacteriaceae bacterium]
MQSIILALRNGELSVNTLATVVDRPATTVSQHLAKLRLIRMVGTRYQGRIPAAMWQLAAAQRGHGDEITWFCGCVRIGAS